MLRGLDRDRGAVHQDGRGGIRRHQAARPKHRVKEVLWGAHGHEHDVPGRQIRRATGDLRSRCRERLCLGGGPVVDSDVAACRQQSPDERRPHPAQPQPAQPQFLEGLRATVSGHIFDNRLHVGSLS